MAFFLRIRGLAVTIVLVALFELARGLGILVPNPVLIAVLALVYASFAGGIWDGAASAMIILAYAAFRFFTPLEEFYFSFFNRPQETLGEILVVTATVPAVAILVSLLKYRLESYSKRLEDIDRAKSEIISLVSHQLRTPLSTVKWYVELLLEENQKLSAEQQTQLREISQSNERMIKLVGDLLNVSRVELGAFGLETEPTDPREIIQAVLSEIQPQIKAKELVVQIHLDVDEKPILLDRRAFHIILENLLSNAVHYTPREGRIDLTLELTNRALILTVRDTGCGIPLAEQGKIFDKLFRGRNARQQVPDGNGLGLYVVKSILDKLGGRISFESKEGQGTSFQVELPRD